VQVLNEVTLWEKAKFTKCHHFHYLSSPDTNFVTTVLPSALARGGCKFCVSLDAVPTFKDLMWRPNGVWTTQTVLTRGSIESRSCRECSTLTCSQVLMTRFRPTKYQSRSNRSCNGQQYCTTCRGIPEAEREIYKFKVTYRLCDVEKVSAGLKKRMELKPKQARSGAYAIIEYFGCREQCNLRSHGNVKAVSGQVYGQRRPSSLQDQQVRLEAGTKPTQVQREQQRLSMNSPGESAGKADSVRKRKARQSSAATHQSSNGDTWLWVLQRQQMQNSAGRRIIRNINQGDVGFTFLMYSDFAALFGSMVTGNDGPYGLS